jgi:hypothetical protein
MSLPLLIQVLPAMLQYALGTPVHEPEMPNHIQEHTVVGQYHQSLGHQVTNQYKVSIGQLSRPGVGKRLGGHSLARRRNHGEQFAQEVERPAASMDIFVVSTHQQDREQPREVRVVRVQIKVRVVVQGPLETEPQRSVAQPLKGVTVDGPGATHEAEGFGYAAGV